MHWHLATGIWLVLGIQPERDSESNLIEVTGPAAAALQYALVTVLVVPQDSIIVVAKVTSNKKCASSS